MFKSFNEWGADATKNKNNRLITELSSIATYNYIDSVLSITERSFRLNDAITFTKHTHYNLKYEPEKYVYTGATVGGVTTGGIHKEGDYHYISSQENTGRYYFNYCGKTVNKIELSDGLLKMAKNSNISKYIEDKYIVIYDSKSVQIHSYVSQGLMSGSLDAMNLGTRYTAMGYPTREKCEEIKNWICGYN